MTWEQIYDPFGKRLQLVLFAFCFGAFLEGAGGGGARGIGDDMHAQRHGRERRSVSPSRTPG